MTEEACGHNTTFKSSNFSMPKSIYAYKISFPNDKIVASQNGEQLVIKLLATVAGDQKKLISTGCEMQ